MKKIIFFAIACLFSFPVFSASPAGVEAIKQKVSACKCNPCICNPCLCSADCPKAKPIQKPENVALIEAAVTSQPCCHDVKSK